MTNQPPEATPPFDNQPPPQQPPPQGPPPAGYGQPAGQPGSYGPPAGYHPGWGQAPPSSSPSTLGGLGDLRFARRITPALAKLVYVAVMILAIITTIIGWVLAVTSFIDAADPIIGGLGMVLNGLVLLIVSPLAAFAALAFTRFWLELFLDHAARSRPR